MDRKGRRGGSEDQRREGERKFQIGLAAYKNPYDKAIVSPTYTSCHLIHTAKWIQPASLL